MKKKAYTVSSDRIASSDGGKTFFISFNKEKAQKFFKRKFLAANRKDCPFVAESANMLSLEAFVNKYNGVIAFNIESFHFGHIFISD